MNVSMLGKYIFLFIFLQAVKSIYGSKSVGNKVLLLFCLFRVSYSRPDKLDQLRDGHDRKLPLFVFRTHKLVYWSLTTALMHCMRVELVDALYIQI